MQRRKKNHDLAESHIRKCQFYQPILFYFLYFLLCKKIRVRACVKNRFIIIYLGALLLINFSLDQLTVTRFVKIWNNEISC